MNNSHESIFYTNVNVNLSCKFPFKLYHQHVRSVSCKIPALGAVLGELTADVVCLTEHWQTELNH